MNASLVRRGAIAAAFAAAVSSAPAGHAANHVTSRAPAAPSWGLPSTTEQQRYRAELGLPASSEVVTDLNARWASGSLPGAGTQGAVFTSEEQREVDGRVAAARDIAAAARAYFDGTLEAAFGGVFIDHETGTTVVLLTRDEAKHTAALRERTQHDDRLGVRTARFSLAQLDGIVATLTDNAAALSSAGASFANAGVSEPENMVDVALIDDAPATRRQVLSLLSPADRAAVRFGPGAAYTPTGVDGLNSPPLKGGQRISRSTPDPTMISICSSAFDAYKRTRTDASIYVTNYYLVTAGHCAPTSADMQRPWVQGRLGGATYPIGVPDMNNISAFGGVDAMRIPINAADAANKVAINETRDRLIYRRQTYNTEIANEPVCMSAATTTDAYGNGIELCGTLIAKGVTLTDATTGQKFANMRVVSFDAKGGDSGGSVLKDSEARGIVQGRGRYPYTTSPFRMNYNHIEIALQRLQLDNVLGVG